MSHECVLGCRSETTPSCGRCMALYNPAVQIVLSGEIARHQGYYCSNCQKLTSQLRQVCLGCCRHGKACCVKFPAHDGEPCFGKKIVVKLIERATSPLNKYVYKLEVTPPGQQATKIKPIASSAGKLKLTASRNATQGSNNSWQLRPILSALGLINKAPKSFFLSPKPMPNMMINNAKGSTTLVMISTCIGNPY